MNIEKTAATLKLIATNCANALFLVFCQNLSCGFPMLTVPGHGSNKTYQSLGQHFEKALSHTVLTKTNNAKIAKHTFTEKHIP